MVNETKVEEVITGTIKKEEFEGIIETLTYVKLWLIISVVIIIKIILIKTVRICKRVYTVHKERLIRQHNETTIQA